MDIVRGTIYSAVALHIGCYVLYTALSALRWNNAISRILLLSLLPVASVVLLLASPDDRGWFVYYRYSLGLILPLGPFLGAYLQLASGGLLIVSRRHGSAIPKRIALLLSITGLGLNAFVAWAFAAE